MSLLTALLLAAWPVSPDALTPVQRPPVRLARKLKVVIDAGHGAPGNRGNTGCFCQEEAAVTLDTAKELEQRLAATGLFELRQARTSDEPRYAQRLASAEAFHADAVISLHTDARGSPVAWQPWHDERVCALNEETPGFALLYSEDGAGPMVHQRAELARALSQRLRQAGFLDYDGRDYGDLYRADDEPGVWVDRRPRKLSVYMLRASKAVPLVIVETHHALDDREVFRWLEPATHHAFATAVTAALLDFAAGQHLLAAK